jgi:pimeloyl-ACP methyl ester carboxylesterase
VEVRDGGCPAVTVGLDVRAEYGGLFHRTELAVQPGSGHVPWLNDPEWFVRILAGFLR